jgi:hypothetical protein
MPRTEPTDEFMATTLDRFEACKKAWEGRREQWTEDARMVDVVGGQWDQAIADRRENAGKPALEFNEEHVYVDQVVNKARQDRPQPTITPGDSDASQEAAEFLEGRLRHIQYASQADVAYDCAVEAAAKGGFGFYRIEKEYTDGNSTGGKPTNNQEPRIKRILDPLTQYPDNRAMEPDLSDALDWFDRGWEDREGFEAKYGAEPIPFDSDHSDPDWSEEDRVCVARYWKVDEDPRRYVWMEDGTEGYADEMDKEPDEEKVLNERDVPDRTLTCYLIDGEKVLDTIPYEGKWIPIIATLGGESIVEGEHILKSVVRFAHGAQKLKNAYKSGIANLLQLASTAPWTGPVGMFKSPTWKDANVENYAFLEWTPVYDKNGQLIAAKPERNSFETPIQSLSVSANVASDDIKRAVGYSDNVVEPSRADLSGVAVLRRSEQQGLTNFHYQDNLIRSQFHCARVVLDLDMALRDTPRMATARKEDGRTFTVPIAVPDDDGVVQKVRGRENEPHLRLDIGRFDIIVKSTKSYDSKIDEETDVLLEILGKDPAAFPVYLDIVFKLLGYKDLEERAKLILPPQIQQAMQANQQGIPPQAQQAIAQSQQRIQQLSQIVQKLLSMIQEKQIETKGKIDVETIKNQGNLTLEKIKTIRALLEQQADHRHDATKTMLGERSDFAQHSMDHVLDLLGLAQSGQQQAIQNPPAAESGVTP